MFSRFSFGVSGKNANVPQHLLWTWNFHHSPLVKALQEVFSSSLLLWIRKDTCSTRINTTRSLTCCSHCAVKKTQRFPQHNLCITSCLYTTFLYFQPGERIIGRKPPAVTGLCEKQLQKKMRANCPHFLRKMFHDGVGFFCSFLHFCCLFFNCRPVWM